jgi:SAM-dependent methyltransferase
MVLAEMITCPICGGNQISNVDCATGRQVVCQTCFHGFRPVTPKYSYLANAMCALGTSEERLEAQCAFFAPFVPPRARMLEIGCATGELAMVVQRTLRPASYDAIELSGAGAIAVTRVSRLYRQTLRELLASGATACGTFDAVLMSHVLEHIEDINGEVEAIATVLKTDGVAFFEVPHASGNIALPVDDNVAHLHFFSPTSLGRLLANHGLDLIAVQSGARLDARYSDSLRVVARRFAPPRVADLDLGAHPALTGGTPVVVWGAGSLATELLANFLNPERIAFFVDKNPTAQRAKRMGLPVRSPQALVDMEPTTILINSIDFAPAIEADICELMPGHRHRLIRIGDVIEFFRNRRLNGRRTV